MAEECLLVGAVVNGDVNLSVFADDITATLESFDRDGHTYKTALWSHLGLVTSRAWARTSRPLLLLCRLLMGMAIGLRLSPAFWLPLLEGTFLTASLLSPPIGPSEMYCDC